MHIWAFIQHNITKNDVKPKNGVKKSTSSFRRPPTDHVQCPPPISFILFWCIRLKASTDFFHCFRCFLGQKYAPSHLLHPFKYKKRGKITFRCNCTSSANSNDDSQRQPFILKKALIVSKLSRYEYEQHRNQRLTATEFERLMRNRGTDYEALMQHHHLHKNFEQKVADSFRQYGVNVKILNRWVWQTEIDSELPRL